MTYSPLARGVLTGKYAPGTPPPEGSRAGRNDKRILQTEFRPESIALAQRVVEHARSRGMTPLQFALFHNYFVGQYFGERLHGGWI